jgi:hypothetical protein
MTGKVGDTHLCSKEGVKTQGWPTVNMDHTPSPIGTLRNLAPLLTSVRESPYYPVMADSKGQDTAHRFVTRTRIKRSRRSNRERSDGGTRTGLRRPAAASISLRVTNAVMTQTTRTYDLQSGGRCS